MVAVLPQAGLRESGLRCCGGAPLWGALLALRLATQAPTEVSTTQYRALKYPLRVATIHSSSSQQGGVL